MFDSWTCHVCGRERPDENISVYTSSHVTATGVAIKQNVRYCNDNLDCIEKAKTHSFFDPGTFELTKE
jgi:hypothetical protein